MTFEPSCPSRCAQRNRDSDELQSPVAPQRRRSSCRRGPRRAGPPRRRPGCDRSGGRRLPSSTHRCIGSPGAIAADHPPRFVKRRAPMPCPRQPGLTCRLSSSGPWSGSASASTQAKPARRSSGVATTATNTARRSGCALANRPARTPAARGPDRRRGPRPASGRDTPNASSPHEARRSPRRRLACRGGQNP